MLNTPRFNRLFASDGKCFDVAIDHGMFGEVVHLEGIENIQKAVETVVAANPDAIQLTPGQARFLQQIAGKHKPSLVLRTDTSNVYGRSVPEVTYNHLIQEAVEQALALDAACVVCNLLLLPNQPALYHQCVDNVCRLKPVCERYAMPLMVEPLVFQPNEIAGGYMVDGDLRKILGLVRQAVELGADVIKADPCDDATEYHQVIQIASGVPVLVRGGGRVPDEEIFQRTQILMQQGAAGIVYGRNVVQHQNPVGMTRALMAMVHDGASAAQAMAILQGV
jgi:DhnA family fructose-bisphosphate aldolase class Ia